MKTLQLREKVDVSLNWVDIKSVTAHEDGWVHIAKRTVLACAGT